MMKRKTLMAIGKRVLVNLLILMAILSLVIAVTGIPMDFGVSYYDGESVISLTVKDALESIKSNFKLILSGDAFKVMIKSETTLQVLIIAAKRSFIVLFFGTLLALVIGVLKGIIDSRKKNKAGTLKLLQSLIPLSLPDILVITLIQLGAMVLFKNDIPILGIGIIPFFGDDTLAHAIFPILSIAILPVAYLSRTVANVIEEGLSKPYILTARGKGCSMFQIIKTHLSKQIAFGVLSVLPTVMGIMFSSLVIVEMFFQYRGIGYHLIYFYTTTLVPQYEAGVAFSVFIVSLALVYYVIFMALNMLKDVVMPRIKAD